MKLSTFDILSFTLIFLITKSYSITGDWKLKNFDGQSTDKDIFLKITQTVLQAGDIKHVLNFSNCQNIGYQVNIKENFMSIDSKSLNRNKSENLTTSGQCTESQLQLEQKISQTLKKVFFFAIKQNFLVFVSPNGNDLFEFSRIKKIYLTNLTGTWLLDEIYWQRASNTQVTVTKQNITFCDGKLIATFTTNNIDEIKFNIEQNNDCDEANITKALNNIRYYRLKGSELQLFDEQSIKVMQLLYKNGIPGQQEKIVNKESKKPVVGGYVTILESENPAKIDQTIEHNLRSDGVESDGTSG